MTITMATKRGQNGLRKWLVIDTERKEYSRYCRRYCPSRDEFIEVSDGDRKKLIEKIESNGAYIEVDYCKEA